jgi:hypothetical protein
VTDTHGTKHCLQNSPLELAQEWVRFWSIAPDRYLDLAPPDVLKAYLEALNSNHELESMASWVKYEIALAKYKHAAKNTRQSFHYGQSTWFDSAAESDMILIDEAPTTQHTSTGRRKRNIPSDDEGVGDFPDSPSCPTGPKRTRLEPISSSLLPTQYLSLPIPAAADHQIRLQEQAQQVLRASDTSAIGHAYTVSLDASNTTHERPTVPLSGTQTRPHQNQNQDRTPSAAFHHTQTTPRTPAANFHQTQSSSDPAPVLGQGQGQTALTTTPAPGSVTHTGRTS